MLFNHPSGKKENLLKQFHLQVRTEIEELNAVLHWFETMAQPYLPDQCFWECQLALSEGFTNTVLYAHDQMTAFTPIELEVKLFPQALEMRIWDYGQPFDLAAKLNSITAQNIHPLEQESDRGLFFMKELTDELYYIRQEDERNCLLMVKKIVFPT